MRKILFAILLLVTANTVHTATADPSAQQGAAAQRQDELMSEWDHRGEYWAHQEIVSRHAADQNLQDRHRHPWDCERFSRCTNTF